MGRNTEALSDKQVTTLEWIRDGCAALDDETLISRRISASSLHRRKLVAVKGRSATWKATITKAGLAWLEQHPNVDIVAPAAGAAADLFARVEAAGGKLQIGEGESAKDACQELVRHWEDFVDLVPVPVPERVARYHPAVKAFAADRDGQMVTKDHVPRAALILQAVADEALRRGFDVLTAEQAKPALHSHGRSEVVCGQLVLRAPAGLCGIRIREISAPGGKPQERYYGHGRVPPGRPRWQDGRDTEFVSAGELELTAEGPAMGYDGYKIRDTSTMTLDERLPRVFRRIDMHRLEEGWRAQERERQAAERQRRWEAAMAEAKARYVEQARWEAFLESSRAWRAVREHREFLAAAREADRATGGAGGVLAAHLDFAERKLDEIDPLADPSRLVPKVPEPKPDDLKPFLKGWSPYGPDSSRW